MPRISRLLLSSLAGLLLVGGAVSPADAAKPNPWLAYYPAEGVTCTSTVYDWRRDTTTEKNTVVKKTAREIVTRTRGQFPVTATLLSHGRMRTLSQGGIRDSGTTMRLRALSSYPSPGALLHDRTGKGTVRLVMTLRARDAQVLLKSGRTFTLTGSYRIAGAGTRSVTLDDDTTTVDTIGMRTTLRSLRLTNVKAIARKPLLRGVRPVFAALAGTTWVAKERGSVLSTSKDENGRPLTARQLGCRAATTRARRATEPEISVLTSRVLGEVLALGRQ